MKQYTKPTLCQVIQKTTAFFFFFFFHKTKTLKRRFVDGNLMSVWFVWFLSIGLNKDFFRFYAYHGVALLKCVCM